MWGYVSAPGFADLDGDGDLDAVVGEYDGTLLFREHRLGVAPAFTELTGAANPFDGVDVGTSARRASPTSTATATSTPWSGNSTAPCTISRTPARRPRRPSPADRRRQSVRRHRCGAPAARRASPTSTATATSTPSSASTTALQLFPRTPARPSRRPSPRGPAPPIRSTASMSANSARPSFADLDGDGDLDAVVGEVVGNADYFENTGTAIAPDFAAQTGAANPFDGVDVGLRQRAGLRRPRRRRRSRRLRRGSRRQPELFREHRLGRSRRPSSSRPAPPIRSMASMWGLAARRASPTSTATATSTPWSGKRRHPALFREHRHGRRAGLRRADRRRQSVRRRRCGGQQRAELRRPRRRRRSRRRRRGRRRQPELFQEHRHGHRAGLRRADRRRQSVRRRRCGASARRSSPTSTATAISTPSSGHSTARCSISRIPARRPRPPSPSRPAPPIRSTASMWGSQHAQLRRPRRRRRPRRHRRGSLRRPELFQAIPARALCSIVDVTAESDAPVLANAIADQISPENAYGPSRCRPTPSRRSRRRAADLRGDARQRRSAAWLAHLRRRHATFYRHAAANFVGNIELKVTSTDAGDSTSDLFFLNVGASNPAPVNLTPNSDAYTAGNTGETVNGLAGNDTVTGGPATTSSTATTATTPSMAAAAPTCCRRRRQRLCDRDRQPERGVRRRRHRPALFQRQPEPALRQRRQRLDRRQRHQQCVGRRRRQRSVDRRQRQQQHPREGGNDRSPTASATSCCADTDGSVAPSNALYRRCRQRVDGRHRQRQLSLGGDDGDTLYSVGGNFLYGEAAATGSAARATTTSSTALRQRYLASSGNSNTLDGGAGNDQLVCGGAHAGNRFVFHPGYGMDTIINFCARGRRYRRHRPQRVRDPTSPPCSRSSRMSAAMR